MLDTSFVIALDSSRIIRTADNGTGSASESSGTENNAASSENTESTGTESGSTTGSESGTTGSETGGTESSGTGSEGGSEETGGTGSESGGSGTGTGTGTDGNGNESGSNSGGENGGNTENPSETGSSGTESDGKTGGNTGNSDGKTGENAGISSNDGKTGGNTGNSDGKTGENGNISNGATNGATNGSTSTSTSTTTTNNASKADPNTKDPETDAAEVDDPNNGSTDAYVPVEEYFNPNIGTTLLYPLPWVGTLVSGFGPRTPFITNSGEMSSSYHRGIDLAIAEGTPIVAAEEGVVTLAEYYGGYGNVVFISHGNGLETRYAHMSQINVKAGDTVKRGQRIGLVGQTGNALGAHLHFEVIYNGTFVNPIAYIEERAGAGSQSVTLNGVTVTVDAEAGAFPVGWTLSVKDASALERVKIEYAISQMREGDTNVLKTHTFDIKILDAEGKEVEPAAGVPVKVSFRDNALNKESLSANIYHIHEDSLVGTPIGQVAPESLETEVEGNIATVTTDGFSYYTVEFTYDGLLYLLEGGSKVPLSNILDKLGLAGTVSAVEVSNEKLFSASDETGEWIVTSHFAFISQEWMKVTIDGVVYEIEVTDANPSNGTFASAADLAEFRIDTSKFVRENAVRNGTSVFEITSGSNLIFDTGTNYLRTGNIGTLTTGTPVNVGSASITFKNAAIDSTGSDNYNVKITVSDVTIYPLASRSNKTFNILQMLNTNSSTVYPRINFGQGGTGNNLNVGLQLDVKIEIIDTAGNVVPDATYFYSFNDFNTSRSTTWSSVNNYYPDANSFNDSVKMPSAADAYYKDSRAQDATYMRDGWYVPGYNGASTGAHGEQASEVVGFSGSSAVTASFRTQLMSGENGKIINFLPDGVTHTITAQSEDSGKYEVYSNGVLDGTGGGTLLYSGKDARTYDAPDGKDVVYKLIPDDPIYQVDEITGSVAGTLADGPDNDGNGLPDYYTYTIPASVVDDQNFTVKWSTKRKFTTTVGDNASYELIDIDDNNNVIDSGTGTNTAEVPMSHAVEYVFTPDSGYALDTFTIDGTPVTNYTIVNDSKGYPVEYRYQIPGDLKSHTVETTWLTRTITTSVGDRATYEVYDVPRRNLIDSGTGTNTITTIPGNDLEFIFTPVSGYALGSLTVDGVVVPATAYTRLDDNNGNPAAYIYTLAGDNLDHTVIAAWTPISCADCKNDGACVNCNLSKDGASLNGYTEEAHGAHRGGNAFSKQGGDSQATTVGINGETQKDDTFAAVLPYGNIFIDTSKLVWNTANKDGFDIDIADSRFKFIGTGTQKGPNYENDPTDLVGTIYTNYADHSIDGHPFDADLIRKGAGNTGSVEASEPRIAYYGPLHSYLMYGTEKNDITNNEITTRYARDNTVASEENIAGRTQPLTYNPADGGSVLVQNGTNMIVPDSSNTKGYLYRVTYYDAAILQDGSRGNLVLTTNAVQLETNYTTPGDVYIGLQAANELLVDSSYVKEGTAQDSLTMANRYIPDGRSNVAPRETVDGLSVRNAVGGKIDIDIQVQLKDGTPVDGIISYALKDLDFGSYESYWGRQPSDTYAGNAGSIADPSISADPIQNAWTGTHKFYEYAESMKINSGALSYAVIPGYNHASGTTLATGKVPIDTIIKGQIANDGFENLTPYEAPLQVINESGNTSSLANGLKFSTTNSKKLRDNNGLLVGEGVVDGATATSTTYEQPMTYTSLSSNQAWGQERKDNLSFDTGFATLLDARKSELQWAGSNNANGKVGTVLFDSTFVQYQFMSHGTGGGIYVEDYELVNNCAPVYRENFITMPYGSTVRTTIVPEDGYRVNRIHYDDVEITLNYDWDPTSATYGEAVSATFKYGGTSQNLDGITGDIPFGGADGNSIARTLKTKDGVESLKMVIIKNDDGTVDVDISERDYTVVNNRPKTSRHDIHADFDADFYFHKVWEGGRAEPSKIPDDLQLTAVPYIAEHDSVTLGGDLYQISKNANNETVYTNTTTQRQYIVKTGPTTSDPTNLPYTKSDKHPVRQYPIVNIEGTIYVIMGNDIYETERTSTGETVVKESTMEEIAVKFERYVDDSYIKATTFNVTKAAAINSNIQNVTMELTDSDVIWKVRYPSEGDSTLGWNELPIEVQDIDAASHDISETHIKRIYWFVQEDIDKLGEKWILRSYSNTYDNTGAVMAGIASYKDYSGHSRFEDKTYWYTESTKDFAYTGSDKVKSTMANIDLAYMSPINENMDDKSGTAYTGWGGKITNRIVETKLRAIKQWFDGGNAEYRDALKLTIKRTYQYSQPSTVPQDTLSITMPTGVVMNDLMDIIAGGKANITGFRRDIEPLLADKLAAIEVDEAGLSITPGQTYTAGSYILYRDQATGAIMYLWFKNGEICYWTDADFDFVFLNADASKMFMNMNNLANIPGAGGFNMSKTTNISKMFAVDNGGATSLEGLDYMRKWDVSKVTDMSEIFAGQTKLYNINGIIDWNVSGIVAAGKTTTGFKNMFMGGHADVANGVRVPFLFYPHFFVTTDGDIDVSNSTVAAEDAEDLIYDYDGDHEKNIGTLTENTASDPNEWIWEIKELLASDATKWKYEAYEDAMIEYHSLDGAVKYENAAVMERDGASGYYQHLFQNKLTLYNVELSKSVTGNMGSRDKYFKFTVDIEDAGEGANITLNTSGMHTQPPSNNAATEASYNATVYKYVKKNGVIVLSTDKAEVDAACTADGGTIATDVIKTTEMGAQNSRDDDPDSAVIVYSEQDIEKAKKYIWETGTSPNKVLYKYTVGEWHEIDTSTGARSKISAPDNSTVRLTYEEISADLEGKEAAKSYRWKDANNVAVTYKYNTTSGTGWEQDNGTSQIAILAPPASAYIIFGDTGGETIAEHYTWTSDSDPNIKYEYVSNVWIKMDESGVYKPVTPSPTDEPVHDATTNYTGEPGQQATTDASGKVSLEVYLQHGEKIILEGLPHGTKYKITEEFADGYRTTIYDGKGREIKRDIVLGNSDIITSGVAGTTSEKDPAGEYYKLKGVDEYENPRDKYAEFTGDFKTLPHYVKNEDGTYTPVTKGTYYLMTDGKYHEENPADRYEDLTTTYVLDVTRAYENSAKAAIPTEIRLRRAAVIILPIALIGLIITFYFRRRRAQEEE